MRYELTRNSYYLLYSKAFTFAVRNCLENRRNYNASRTLIDASSLQDAKAATKDPVEALLELQLTSFKVAEGKRLRPKTKSNAPKPYSDCLLQNVDIFRLKALVYRDVVRNEKNKAKPFVIVVCFCLL